MSGASWSDSGSDERAKPGKRGRGRAGGAEQCRDRPRPGPYREESCFVTSNISIILTCSTKYNRQTDMFGIPDDRPGLCSRN